MAVRGARARVMLWRTAWADVLMEAAEWAARPGQARYLFRPGSHARGTKTVTDFLARAKEPPGTPRLVMGRTRATWLVDAVEARMMGIRENPQKRFSSPLGCPATINRIQLP